MIALVRTGLDKSRLKKSIKASMSAGFMNAFKDGCTTKESTESLKKLAKSFAEETADGLTDAIETYITSAVLVPDIPEVQNFTVTASGAMGAVTGTAIGNVTQKYKMT